MPPYPPEAMRHLAAPVGAGAMSAPDAAGESGSAGCGDLVRVALRISGGLSLIHISEPTRPY